jgi:transposase-like protein
MAERVTITSLIERIPDEASAYHYLEQLRWPGKPVCPHCGSINDHYFLKPQNEAGRKTRTGTVSHRRVWKCKDCRKQFSVLTGTIFHGSKVPVRLWIFVFFEMCSNKNGIAAREIERKYGVAPKTAWFMTQRIREAMNTRGAPLMRGIVQADETWIGGNPEKMNAKQRASRDKKLKGTNANTAKTSVFALIEERTGEVRTKVVPNVRSATLRQAINENVQAYGSILHTDSLSSYQSIGRKFTAHHAVDHDAGQFFDKHTKASTNKVENFFGQMKRSINGTHDQVSPEHLHRYVAEFAFRNSTHRMPDTERIGILMDRVVGRRLVYKQVIMP